MSLQRKYLPSLVPACKKKNQKYSAMCVKLPVQMRTSWKSGMPGVKLKKLGTQGRMDEGEVPGKNRIHQERFIKNGKIIKTS